jgi:fatty acid desaturase
MTENNEKIWKKFLCKHWKMFALFLIGALIAILGAILVFLWFVGDAQSTGIVPELLGSWSMGYLVTFLLHLIFWEIVYVAIPVLIALAAIYFLWWKRLPEEERKEYKEKHLFGKSSKSKDGGKQ